MFALAGTSLDPGSNLIRAFAVLLVGILDFRLRVAGSAVWLRNWLRWRRTVDLRHLTSVRVERGHGHASGDPLEAGIVLTDSTGKEVIVGLRYWRNVREFVHLLQRTIAETTPDLDDKSQAALARLASKYGDATA
jgi:hypothetical protein